MSANGQPLMATVQRVAVYGLDGRLRREIEVDEDGRCRQPVRLSADEAAYAVVPLPGGRTALSLLARGPRRDGHVQRPLRARLQRAWDAYMGRPL